MKQNSGRNRLLHCGCRFKPQESVRIHDSRRLTVFKYDVGKGCASELKRNAEILSNIVPTFENSQTIDDQPKILTGTRMDDKCGFV
jgi:hypothetical protein